MEDAVNSSDDELRRLTNQFEESEHTTADARKLSERDRDYYDEKQLTPAEISALEARGQPAVVFNRVKRKVNAMMGLEKQTRKDPKAFPRNPDDEQSAQAATDAIRYVCDASRWDDKRSQGAKELSIEGTCAIMVGVKKSRDGIDPDIKRIAWDRFYHDPHSSEFDFADAAYMGVVIWMDLAKAQEKWPKAKDALQATWESARETETYDDKPKHNLWADHRRRRVRICEHYYNEGGEWRYCLFTKRGFVVEPQASPYLGEDDVPECPIKAVSLYIDRDNNRYGEVRTMIGPQDEINKRRSKALHLISQRQVRVSPSVGLDAQAIRKELSRPDGVFVGEVGEVEVLPTNDMAAANLTMLQEAKTEIDLLGPNAALGGKNTQDMSGRAIMAQQQGGMVEQATFLDCLRVLSIAVYRSVWCRIRQHWKEERWIRVTDSDRDLRFVGLNKPISNLEDYAAQQGITKENLPQMQQQNPEAVAELQQLAQHPAANQIARIENNVGELDVDIVLDEGIDTPTVAAEQFDTFVKMMPALFPQGAPPEAVQMLVQASSLRDKDKLAEIIEKMNQAPSPEQQAVQQIQIAGAKADVEKTQSETAKNTADAQATMAGVQMDAFQMGHQAGQGLGA